MPRPNVASPPVLTETSVSHYSVSKQLAQDWILVTPKEAARILCVDRRVVYQYGKTGKLPKYTLPMNLRKAPSGNKKPRPELVRYRLVDVIALAKKQEVKK